MSSDPRSIVRPATASRAPRSIRLHFDNARPGEPRLTHATAMSAGVPSSADRGPRDGVTGTWVQLEDAQGSVLYRWDTPSLLVPHVCAAAGARENPIGESAWFEVRVPARRRARWVAVYAPPLERDGARPLLGRASTLLVRCPMPRLEDCLAVRPRAAADVDLCGNGRGTVGQVVAAVNHGSRHGVYTLVVLAERFGSAEQDLFLEKANDCLGFLLSRLPFSTAPFAQALNVYFVHVSSDGGQGYFGSTWGSGTTIDWDTACVSSVCDSLFADAGRPFWDWAGLIVNEDSDRIGTARGRQFACGLSSSYEEIFHHELGHSAFGLGDEYSGTKGSYTGAEPASPNLTRQSSTPKWSAFVTPGVPIPTLGNPTDCSEKDSRKNPVEDSDVGLYAGGKGCSCGIFHPQYRCAMNASDDADGTFCAVCLHAAAKVIARAIGLDVPAPGSLRYSKATGAWSHVLVPANVVLELAELQDFDAFEEVVAELLAGQVGTAVRDAFQEDGETLPTELQVVQGSYEPSTSTGVWFLIEPATRETWFVHTFRRGIYTEIRPGRIALPEFLSGVTFEGVPVGIEIDVFSCDGGLLARGTIDPSGSIVGGELAVQQVDGLADEATDVSALRLGQRIWVVVSDALQAKCAAYQLIGETWSPSFAPLVASVDLDAVRAVAWNNEVLVLARASGGLWQGRYDTVSDAWSGPASQTAVSGAVSAFDVATDGTGLWLVAVLEGGIALATAPAATGDWSAPVLVGDELGLEATAVVSALAVAVLGADLHLVVLVDQTPRHAIYDLAGKTWRQPLTPIRQLDALVADIAGLSLHATATQLVLLLGVDVG